MAACSQRVSRSWVATCVASGRDWYPASRRRVDHAFVWTGVKSSEPGGRRIVLEVDFKLANKILAMLADEAGQAWAPEDFATTAKVAKDLPAPDYSSMKVGKLRKAAKTEGIKGGSTMAKAALVKALS